MPSLLTTASWTLHIAIAAAVQLSALSVYVPGDLTAFEDAIEVEEQNWASLEGEFSEALDALVEKHTQATMGGRNAEEVTALTLSGNYTLDGQSYPFVVKKMRPHYFRLELSTPNGLMVQGFDGSRGWLLPAGFDAENAEWMAPGPSKTMQRDAIMFNYLVEREREPVQLSLAGSSDTKPGDLIGIQAQLPDGGLIRYWLNPETALIEREVKTDFSGNDVKITTAELSDFRNIDGLQIAHYVKHFRTGEPESELRVESVEIVESFPPEIFSPAIDKPGNESD
ncbi:MAG: hypothetical protein AAFX93_09500 [Verrucomicrobiota bacterium]